MKAILGFVALVIIALVLYTFLSDTSSVSNRLKDSMTVQPKRETGSVPAPSVPMPAGAVGTASLPPAPTTPDSAAQSILPRIQAAASQSGVTIKNIQFSGKNVTVTLDWIGDVATNGGDFIDHLYRQGIIRDFEDVPDGRRWFDEQNRSHFHQSYVLKLP